MLTHLEAYEIGLIAWAALLAIAGSQGLISAFLEDPEPRESEPRAARGSWGAFSLVVILIVLELLWAVLFVAELLRVDNVSAGALAGYGALLCFTLAAAFIVYRRAFISNETLFQERDEEVPW
jgi:hypothetical protein